MNITQVENGYIISNGSNSVHVYGNGNINLSKIAKEFNINIPDKSTVNIKDAILMTSKYKALNNFLFEANDSFVTESKLKHLKEENKRLKINLETSDSEVSKSENTDELRESFNIKLNSLNETIHDLENKDRLNTNDILRLNEEIDNYINEINDQSSEIQKHIAEKINIESELNESENKLKNKTKELDDKILELNESENKLKNKIKELNLEKDKYDIDIKNRENIIREIKQQINHLTNLYNYLLTNYNFDNVTLSLDKIKDEIDVMTVINSVLKKEYKINDKPITFDIMINYQMKINNKNNRKYERYNINIPIKLQKQSDALTYKCKFEIPYKFNYNVSNNGNTITLNTKECVNDSEKLVFSFKFIHGLDKIQLRIKCNINDIRSNSYYLSDANDNYKHLKLFEYVNVNIYIPSLDKKKYVLKDFKNSSLTNINEFFDYFPSYMLNTDIYNNIKANYKILYYLHHIIINEYNKNHNMILFNSNRPNINDNLMKFPLNSDLSKFYKFTLKKNGLFVKFNEVDANKYIEKVKTFYETFYNSNRSKIDEYSGVINYTNTFLNQLNNEKKLMHAFSIMNQFIYEYSYMINTGPDIKTLINDSNYNDLNTYVLNTIKLNDSFIRKIMFDQLIAVFPESKNYKSNISENLNLSGEIKHFNDKLSNSTSPNMIALYMTQLYNIIDKYNCQSIFKGGNITTTKINGGEIEEIANKYFNKIMNYMFIFLGFIILIVVLIYVIQYYFINKDNSKTNSNIIKSYY